MMNRFQLGITRRFMLLFVLTVICPLIVMSGLFFHTVDTKLNERILNQLRTGLLLSNDICLSGLKRMELIANQAASLFVNEKYECYLKTGKSQPLERILN